MSWRGALNMGMVSLSATCPEGAFETRLKLVVIDETRAVDEATVAQAGMVFSVYLFDSMRKEMKNGVPHYDLHPVSCYPLIDPLRGGAPSELEVLLDGLFCKTHLFADCASIDAMDDGCFHDFGSSYAESEDDHHFQMYSLIDQAHTQRLITKPAQIAWVGSLFEDVFFDLKNRIYARYGRSSRASDLMLNKAAALSVVAARALVLYKGAKTHPSLVADAIFDVVRDNYRELPAYGGEVPSPLISELTQELRNVINRPEPAVPQNVIPFPARANRMLARRSSRILRRAIT